MSVGGDSSATKDDIEQVRTEFRREMAKLRADLDMFKFLAGTMLVGLWLMVLLK